MHVLHSDEMGFKPIYTDTDMYNSDLLQEIEQAVEEINKLRETLRETSPPFPEDWELVLELAKDDETSEPICRYYFACLSTRCLFWLHEFDLESVLEDVCGVTEKTHIRKSLGPTLSIYRTKRMTRPGVASSVLVSDNHVDTVTS